MPIIASIAQLERLTTKNIREYSIPLYNQDSLQDAAADLNVSPQLQGKNEYVCNTRKKLYSFSPMNSNKFNLVLSPLYPSHTPMYVTPS